MTFLTLAQTLREKCGMAGSGPSTVVGQSGESLRVVNWINEAWLDIQNRHNWDFMREDFSFVTVSGTQAYTPSGSSGSGAALTDHKAWWPDTFRCYLTSLGSADIQYLPVQDYAWFRDVYQFSTLANGRPTCWAQRKKDRAILLGNTPDAVYTITGQYQKAGSKMAVADASMPTGLPTELEYLIVFRAMQKYASYEAAPEVMNEARAEYKALLTLAGAYLLPDIDAPEPLA